MSLAIEMADALDEGHPHHDDAIAAELRRLHARSEEQERLLRRIALVAHFGGWASLSEADALTIVRKLTIEHMDGGVSYADATSELTAIRKHLGDKT